jgi:membrane-associated protease RseP (regulator of RpoE activity)
MSFPTDQRPLHQEPADRAHLVHEIVPLTVDEVPPRSFPMLPAVLFLLTCYTTYGAGGPAYSFALMLTLVCHEFGHYIQARRYRVPASLPYFIPIPAPPLGTMGAVIAMRGEMPNRRALFDIGISGPLAGLVPALIFTVWGLSLSTVVPKQPSGMLGDPLLFKFLVRQFFGVLPSHQDVLLHPLAYAGWVGVLITSLNLMPIGQLDGGHILYAILRRKAHVVAWALLVGAVTAVVLMHSYQWTVMLLLLAFMGPTHPPTANDEVPLGTPRIVLGWITLAFVIIGFTPRPFAGF